MVIDKNLFDCNANVVEMKAGSAINITKADAYKEKNLHTYYQLIEKLIYLKCGTKSDITFAVDQLSKHNTDPHKNHLQVAKKVISYLKSSINLGLVYEKTNQQLQYSPLYNLIGYVKTNFAGNSKDRKSIMGYYFALSGAVVL